MEGVVSRRSIRHAVLSVA